MKREEKERLFESSIQNTNLLMKNSNDYDANMYDLKYNMDNSKSNVLNDKTSNNNNNILSNTDYNDKNTNVNKDNEVRGNSNTNKTKNYKYYFNKRKDNSNNTADSNKTKSSNEDDYDKNIDNENNKNTNNSNFQAMSSYTTKQPPNTAKNKSQTPISLNPLIPKSSTIIKPKQQDLSKKQPYVPILMLKDSTLQMNYDYSFKIIILGDSGVGKSSFAYRAIHDKPLTYSELTMGFEYFNMLLEVKNRPIKLQIWDTCGQEIYHSLVSTFFRDTDMAILVYSIENKKSFNSLTRWIKDLNDKSRDAYLFLLGNKSDLNDSREVFDDEVDKLMSEFNFSGCTISSAKDGKNCREVFYMISEYLLSEVEKIEKGVFNEISNTNGKINSFKKRHASVSVKSRYESDASSEVYNYDDQGNRIKIREKGSCNKCLVCNC